MADFCKQCSLDMFGEDYGELRGLGYGQDVTLKEGEGWTALCEGCGLIVVNDDGECIDQNCTTHGVHGTGRIEFG